MANVPCPVRGQIITYAQRGVATVPVYDRAVATGAVLIDPLSGCRWLPVIHPDLRQDLIDAALVVGLGPVR
jgi:hypothetical protein